MSHKCMTHMSCSLGLNNGSQISLTFFRYSIKVLNFKLIIVLSVKLCSLIAGFCFDTHAKYVNVRLQQYSLRYFTHSLSRSRQRFYLQHSNAYCYRRHSISVACVIRGMQKAPVRWRDGYMFYIFNTI